MGQKPGTDPMGMKLKVGTSSPLADFSLSDSRRVVRVHEIGLLAIAYFLFHTPLMRICGKVKGFVESEDSC